ncbi:hypothetical protein IEQ34_016860 [Dendrobium chrysotoxum]|uniref:Uncharacterized protein n=1 Tax=Dendrobium chrysotoxum TaxID=161865 RepID=A0AAV7GEL4_DENCH|nr:hypothetical protein IEQ34_016860 [Dendrobium chrysotoxum]
MHPWANSPPSTEGNHLKVSSLHINMILLKPFRPKDLRFVPILRIPCYCPRINNHRRPCWNVIAHHLAPLFLSLLLVHSSSPMIFVMSYPNTSLTSVCAFFIIFGLRTSSEIAHSKVVDVVSLPAIRIS